VVEFNILYNRRRDLLEQIGNAADEIKQIDVRLASLGLLSVEETSPKEKEKSDSYRI
jgi:hypothetical protein